MGVGDALLAPVRWLAPFLSERLSFVVTDMGGGATVGEYLSARNLPPTITPRSAAAGELADAARTYVIYRASRHSRMAERQRRHPLIFGWPVIFRLLTQRALR